jgi:hypothetical protein
MVIAPANTGNESNNRTEVTKTDQIYSGTLLALTPGPRILIIVVMKFIEPAIDETPAKCKLNIAKSVANPF